MECVRCAQEIEANSPEGAKAREALKKEWDRLRKMKCWDEAGVREWDDVASEARRKNIKAHQGRFFAICVEKNSEPPEGDPSRKYKGRVPLLPWRLRKPPIALGASQGTKLRPLMRNKRTHRPSWGEPLPG